MRRLTREQRVDVLSKRPFDKFVGSPRNLGRTEPTLDEQTAHGARWTWSTRLQRVHVGSQRVSPHEGVCCQEAKQAFFVAKARAEELRAAEAETWRTVEFGKRRRSATRTR